MDQIVEIYEDELRAGTFIISEGFQRRHAKVIKLINKHKKQFLEFGVLPVRRVKTKGRPVIELMLNNNQIMFLLSLIRTTGGNGNNSIAEFKCEAIKAGNIIAVLVALNSFDFGESRQRYVYAAQDEFGRIKVGISNNPEQRIKQLNTGNADELKLVFTREAKGVRYSDETLLHNQCERYNIRSEWFEKEAIKCLE